MKQYFTHQTGNIQYGLNLRANTTSGSAVISMGCNGISVPTLSFNLDNGFIKTTGGLIIGSYLSNENFALSGVVAKDFSTVEYNGLSIVGQTPINNFDMNHWSLTKTQTAPVYNAEMTIVGRFNDINKNLLYITNSPALETGMIDLISGMNIFSGDSGVATAYNAYTGNFTGSQLAELNSYDAIVFGEKVNAIDFQDTGNWSKVASPIIFFGAEAATQSGVYWLTGTWKVTDTGIYISGQKNIDILIQDRNFAKMATRRLVDGETLFLNTTGEFFFIDNETTGYKPIVYCTGATGYLRVFDYAYVGETISVTAPTQSGVRILFNTPRNSSNVFDVLTDQWRMLFAATLFEITQNKAVNLPSWSSSSNSSSSNSSTSSASSASSSSSASSTSSETSA